MKHANGAGSVTKLKDRKRKPWKAVVTVGFGFDAESGQVKQHRKVLGCFRTRTEAENALADYRRNPYDLDARKLTFAAVYEKWSAIHYEKISASKVRAYRAAYTHALPLHSMKFTDIRPHHIEQTIAEVETGSATKNNVKQLCNLLYKYALKNEICTVNYASMCDGVKQDAPKITRKIFSPDEENALWQNLDYPYTDIVLIALYSGWRPQELASLKVSDIDLENGVMYGGLKTAAGKGRAVPIHSAIRPLIATRIREGQEWLFVSENGKTLKYFTYRKHFLKLCKHFGITHTPHDTRHTFVTRGKEAGMNEHILKLIVGHAITDITEKIYTHRKIEELKAEIEKIVAPK